MNRSNRETETNNPSTAGGTKDSGRDQQNASRLASRDGTTGESSELDGEQGISNRPDDAEETDADIVTDGRKSATSSANSQGAGGQRSSQKPGGGQKNKETSNRTGQQRGQQAADREGRQSRKTSDQPQGQQGKRKG